MRFAGDESPKYNQYYGLLETVSEEVTQKLQAFRRRAEQIMRESPPRRSSNSALTKVAEGAVGRVASDLVISKDLDWIVPGRTASSAVRKFLRNSAKEGDKKAFEAWNSNCQVAVDQLTREVKDFLSSLSIYSPSLTVVGNSSKLVRKLNVVYKCSRPQSRAKALGAVLDEIMALDLIPNDRITMHLAEQYARSESEANRIVTNLEKILRKCVEECLSKKSSNWWEERVPLEIRKRAEKRRNEDSKVYPRVAEPGDLMSFVGFADYSKIICHDQNWACFEGIFKDKAWLSIKLGELDPVRNALMHSRNLTKHGLERLRVNSDDIVGRLRCSQ